MEVHNEKELGEALKNNVDSIEIGIDLKQKVIIIKGVNNAAWGICIAAVGIGVAAVMASAMTAGTTAPVNALIATPALAGAVGILGVPTAISAVSIAVAGGGVACLNKLRKYKIKEISDDKIQLIRK